MRAWRLCCIFLVAALLGGVGCSSSSDKSVEPTESSRTGPPPDTTLTAVASLRTPETPSAIPQLTEEDRTRAAEILRADSFLGPLLVQRPDAFPDGFGIWHSGRVKLGAGTDLIFNPPITLEHDWPYVVDSEGEVLTDEEERAMQDNTYVVGTYKARATDITNLAVLIDLRRNEVVSISPYKSGPIQLLD